MDNGSLDGANRKARARPAQALDQNGSLESAFRRAAARPAQALDRNGSLESAFRRAAARPLGQANNAFEKRHAWAVYEAVKRRLREMNLPPADYERMVRKLAAFLGI